MFMILSFWVYMLSCSDGAFYVGHTDNLEKRIAEHQSGEIKGYTCTRLPVTLVFSQEFATRDEAFRFERQIKGWSRAKKEALIKCDWEKIKQLARFHPSTGSG